MAVAFGSVVSATPASGSSVTSPSITPPTTNPVVIVAIGLADNTATISSVTTTLSGTPTKIKELRGSVSTDALVSLWAIPAPGSAAGTVTVNFSAAVQYELVVLGYSGADQTTPCPTADAVSVDSTSNQTLTPTNLTANDATVAANVNTQAQDVNTPSPNSRFVSNTTPCNIAVGDNFGTSGVSLGTTSGLDAAYAGIRIKAAGGAGSETLSGADTITNFVPASSLIAGRVISEASLISAFTDSSALVAGRIITEAALILNFSSVGTLVDASQAPAGNLWPWTRRRRRR